MHALRLCFKDKTNFGCYKNISCTKILIAYLCCSLYTGFVVKHYFEGKLNI